MGASWKRNPLQIGMMLEGVDPRNQSLFCVLSVSEVRGHRVRLHLEGYSPSFDFWMSYYSPVRDCLRIKVLVSFHSYSFVYLFIF